MNINDITSIINGLGKFSPVIDLISKNGFDFNKILSGVNLENLLPFIKGFFGGENKSPTASAAEPSFAPVISIADKDIIYSLSRYFAS